MRRFDLHVHSRFSHDSLMRAKNIVRTARKKGLSGIAITDHDTIAGGLEAKKYESDDFIIIVGAEYQTSAGHILGLFLRREIAASRDSQAVISAIHEQGGLAILAHPYKYESAISWDLLKALDALEICNSRAENVPGSGRNNIKARELAAQGKLGITAGSDAHFLFEIGRSVWQCDEVLHERDVYRALKEKRGACTGRYTSVMVEGMSQMVKSYKLQKWEIVPKTLLKIPFAYIKALGMRPLRKAGK